ncbi:MAG: sigma-70 family RNA polymerase sigma factor [candidate division Zixibacteria bacterium]|nr:sigma-70 family RNA polymerase sigma factor [candidate division Zixibacteria bacterium]MBU1471428.1 sigma-70 family RNA polymerase sigma factor [candidate division Zixibacteria bacterium]MBU2625332.1 sigma-70 family RNA polymerase sigma factor [candidate division Zixibacteria bacterium]
MRRKTKGTSMLQREKLPDYQLMERIQKDDMVSFNTLVNRYKNRLFNVLVKMLDSSEAAEDILQETFLRVHLHKMSFDFRFAVSTWIYTIALNLARNELRRRKRVQFFDIEDFSNRLQAPEEKVDNSSKLRAVLDKAVKKLPQKYRQAFVLRDMDQLSYEEIAQILSVPLGTVKSRVNRARNMLRNMLKPNMEELYELSKGSVFTLGIY